MLAFIVLIHLQVSIAQEVSLTGPCMTEQLLISYSAVNMA